MCALFVGDVQWLQRACDIGQDLSPLHLECLSGEERDFSERVSSSAVVVMMTDQVSHAIRRQVLCVASANRVPVYMRHSCGVSSMGTRLREASLDR